MGNVLHHKKKRESPFTFVKAYENQWHMFRNNKFFGIAPSCMVTAELLIRNRNPKWNDFITSESFKEQVHDKMSWIMYSLNKDAYDELKVNLQVLPNNEFVIHFIGIASFASYNDIPSLYDIEQMFIENADNTFIDVPNSDEYIHLFDYFINEFKIRVPNIKIHSLVCHGRDL